MKQFSDFAIESKRCFIGPKVAIEDILEKEIIVEHFSISDSNKKPGTECLTIQVFIDDRQQVIFTGSTFLMHSLRNLQESDFPFKAKIIRINRHFEFR